MKTAFFVLGSMAMVACGQRGSEAPSTVAETAAHFNASHCEIFVDKVSAITSSHGMHGITFFLKTINARLDGAIAEVGIRRNETSQIPPEMVGTVSEWKDVTFMPYMGSGDYFEGTVALGSNFRTLMSEAVFYVRTVVGTTYWLKQAAGGNFMINDQMFRRVYSLYAQRYPHYSMIPTQAEDSLRDFNPDQCR